MGTFYNRNDPRLAGVRQQARGMEALDLEGFDRAAHLRNTYYEGTGVNRNGQTTADAYHDAIEAVAQQLFPRPTVIYQGDWSHISLLEVRDRLDADPMAFIHFEKFPGAVKPTRLYIPCRLDRVTNFFQRLWARPGLAKFKVVGYGDATSRADVIVAWFLATEHARAVGAHFDANHGADLYGTFPIGAFPCSGANLCGWAPEIGSSVGTDVSHDLAVGGDSRARAREV